MRLVSELTQGSTDKQTLFVRLKGGRSLTLNYLDKILREATTLALGRPGSFNLIRRANALDGRTSAERSAQLINGLADTHYHPRLALNRFEATAAARRRRCAAAMSITRG